MQLNSIRDEIIEVVNRLFIYTDDQNWDSLQNEVFAEKLIFDMSSVNGESGELTAKSICEAWAKGFVGIDAINHLAGNYLVEVNDNQAKVFAYATATHFKANASKGKTREFVGTYNIQLVKETNGWRIIYFKYNLKYANGNLNLE